MVENSIKNIDQIIDFPEKTSDKDLNYLFDLSIKNSYSGICFLMIAKVIKAQNRTGLDNILKSAALRSNNRTQLFNIINGVSKKNEIYSNELINDKSQNLENKDIEKSSENVTENNEDQVFLQNNIYNNLISNELINEIENSTSKIEEEEEISIEVDNETEFTFERWLYKSAPKEKSNKERTVDEILRSLENRKTQKEKKQFFSASDTAKKSLEENHTMDTETLAEVYVKQGNYPKAIAIYEQLMLSIPEKKLLFASRIKYINQKTKL
tara:strand:+ start:2434 stop:3237 length:804 start_codon:yes stop_codon:yes gene_type:complete